MKKTLLKINSTAPVCLFILSNVWILWIFGYYQVQKTKEFGERSSRSNALPWFHQKCFVNIRVRNASSLITDVHGESISYRTLK